MFNSTFTLWTCQEEFSCTWCRRALNDENIDPNNVKILKPGDIIHVYVVEQVALLHDKYCVLLKDQENNYMWCAPAKSVALEVKDFKEAV